MTTLAPLTSSRRLLGAPFVDSPAGFIQGPPVQCDCFDERCAQSTFTSFGNVQTRFIVPNALRALHGSVCHKPFGASVIRKLSTSVARGTYTGKLERRHHRFDIKISDRLECYITEELRNYFAECGVQKERYITNTTAVTMPVAYTCFLLGLHILFIGPQGLQTQIKQFLVDFIVQFNPIYQYDERLLPYADIFHQTNFGKML